MAARTKTKTRRDQTQIEQIVIWSRVLVVRSLIAAGWSNRRLAAAWPTMERRLREVVASHAVPDAAWVCEVQVAEIVADELARATPGRWA